MLYNQGPVALKKLEKILKRKGYLWTYLKKGPKQTRKGIERILAYLNSEGK